MISLKNTETLDNFYDCVIANRNRRLDKSTATGDYEFIVAHGITEVMRMMDEFFNFEDCEEIAPFTRKEIAEMSHEDFTLYEGEIINQMARGLIK